MINGMTVCSNLWLTFFVLWILAGLRTKRTVQQVRWAQRLFYTIPAMLGFYCMFMMELDIPWLQKRILPRTPALAAAAIVITLAGMALAVRPACISAGTGAASLQSKSSTSSSAAVRIVLYGTPSIRD